VRTHCCPSLPLCWEHPRGMASSAALMPSSLSSSTLSSLFVRDIYAKVEAGSGFAASCWANGPMWRIYSASFAAIPSPASPVTCHAPPPSSPSSSAHHRRPPSHFLVPAEQSVFSLAMSSSDLPRPPPSYEPAPAGTSTEPLLGEDRARHSDDDIPDDFKYHPHLQGTTH
jgi:hypothetical protein